MYRRSLTAIAILGLAAAGCGGSSGSGGSGASSTGASGASGTSTAATGGSGSGATLATTSGTIGDTATVEISESEWAISVASTTITAGRVRFSVTDGGTVPHNLTIDGPGVSSAATETIAAGASGSVTADLEAGTYDLYCSIPGHRANGMDLKIAVAAS